ncbi:hypothetical protein BaRGS_00001560 [Batillaria attramentaria]|uniref:Uncharacterized protein n=1 Tax=Batillaria attramentaria TaxID=370345 RepID=A0ABD0M7C3_9CAEN
MKQVSEPGKGVGERRGYKATEGCDVHYKRSLYLEKDWSVHLRTRNCTATQESHMAYFLQPQQCLDNSTFPCSICSVRKTVKSTHSCTISNASSWRLLGLKHAASDWLLSLNAQLMALVSEYRHLSSPAHHTENQDLEVGAEAHCLTDMQCRVRQAYLQVSQLSIPVPLLAAELL